MRKVLEHIEPRSAKAGTVLIDELDEFLEVIFFVTGDFRAGYSLNAK